MIERACIAWAFMNVALAGAIIATMWLIGWIDPPSQFIRPNESLQFLVVAMAIIAEAIIWAVTIIPALVGWVRTAKDD